MTTIQLLQLQLRNAIWFAEVIDPEPLTRPEIAEALEGALRELQFTATVTWPQPVTEGDAP
jgi:hypothetical protein